MVEIKNSKDLLEWLEGKPSSYSVVIASRVALRILPVLEELFGTRKPEPNCSYNIVLPIFRALSYSLFFSKHDGHRDLNINTSLQTLIEELTSSTDAHFPGFSYVSVLHSAILVLGTVLENTHVSAAAVDVVNVATSDNGIVFSAIFDDITRLDQGVLPEELAGFPLWIDWNRDEFGELSDHLKRSLLALDENWDVWLDWFEDVLLGRNQAGLPDDLAEELGKKLAVQSDGWWKRDVAAVNGDIQTWTAELFEESETRQRVAKQKEFALEHMTEWFFSNFEDPQYQTPYDSESGDYVFLEGGPYDAREQFEEFFLGRYTVKYIDEAVDAVEASGVVDWAPVHDYGLINKPKWDDILWPFEEPESALGPDYRVVDGKFSIVAHLPAENELSSQLGLHQNLRNQVIALASVVGSLENQYPALVSVIKEYANLLASDIEELDVTAVWSVGGALGSFQSAYAQQGVNGTLEIPLEPNVVAQLQSISRLHGAFIMGFAEGRKLVERADAFALDRQLLDEIEIPGGKILDELSDNQDLVDDDTRAKHRPVRDAVHEFGWASARNGYAAYGIVRNGTIASTKFVLKTVAAIIVVQGVSTTLGDPNMLVAKAAIEYLQTYGSQLLSFFNHSPEMRAYIEHVLKMIADDANSSSEGE